MSDDTKTPIIVGLAVGVAFVVLFSIFFISKMPFYPISDMKLQKNMEQTREVEALLSRYPDANVQFHQGGDGRRTIDYSAFADESPQGEGYGSISHMLSLNIEVHPVTGQMLQMVLTCSISDGINDAIQKSYFENIEEEILKGDCLNVTT